MVLLKVSLDTGQRILFDSNNQPKEILNVTQECGHVTSETKFKDKVRTEAFPSFESHGLLLHSALLSMNTFRISARNWEVASVPLQVMMLKHAALERKCMKEKMF